MHHCTAICFNLVEINKVMLARQNNNFKKVFGIKIRFYHFISCAPYTSLLFLDQLIRVLNTIPKKEKLSGLREKYEYYIKNCIKYFNNFFRLFYWRFVFTGQLIRCKECTITLIREDCVAIKLLIGSKVCYVHSICEAER